MRDENGKFIKGNAGFWLGKKRPGLFTETQFKKGQIPFNKGLRQYKVCETCKSEFTTNKGTLTKPKQRFCSMKCFGIARRGKDYENKVINRTFQYLLWRREVLKRDKKCVWCGSREQLQVDHIKPKKHYPELALDINNGRVLCFPCHKKTPTYGSKAKVLT